MTGIQVQFTRSDIFEKAILNKIREIKFSKPQYGVSISPKKKKQMVLALEELLRASKVGTEKTGGES